ncbi:MAG: fatty acyl-AMP ligase [Thermodesulfobacteria bacterium]|nr:fatty acyl-AMP ligase [Thermodesulfobacteriota bacterium]
MKVTPTESGIPIKHATFETLAQALDYAAQGETGYNFFGPRGKLREVLPYSLLKKEALSLARKLLSLGFPRGSRIALLAHTDPLFVKFFFACQYAGYVPVPLPLMLQLNSAENYVSQLVRFLEISSAKAFFAPPEFLKFVEEAAQRAGLEIFGSEDVLSSVPESAAGLEPLSAEELAYIQFTSGSTRFPRGVMVTQRALMHNLHLISKYGVSRQEGDRAVSWLPFYHDMGLVGLVLAPLAAQVSVDYMSPKDFIVRPGLWLRLISEHRATISFSPPFGYELAAMRLKEEDLKELDLSSWRIAGVGAEMIRFSVLEKFAEKFAPCGFDSRAFTPCYGMAECTLAISFTTPGEGVKTDVVNREVLAREGRVKPCERESREAKVLVRCGRPLPGLEVEVRAPDGRVLPEEQVGVLFVRGESVMAGYLGDPEATREVLKDGWLNTGDLAYLREGEIVITGRVKDMIIVHGKNVWPQDIENLAESLPEVRSGNACAFAIPDEEGKDHPVLVVQVSLSPEKEATLKARLASLIRKELGIDCLVVLVPKNTIVRTTSGKPARSHTRKVCQEKGYLPLYFSKKVSSQAL